MCKKPLTLQQEVALELIRCDLKYLYTVMMNRNSFDSNYIVSLLPYIGVIVDGIEEWISAMSRACPGVINGPLFNEEEKHFYELLRLSIKFWEKPYDEVYACLQNGYCENEVYFSSLCKPIARHLHLYDIFGADLANGHFCGNTVLSFLLLPGYKLGDENYGPNLQNLAEIGGKYIAFFQATETYKTNESVNFEFYDYGGLRKSPVGNLFSHRFVLFSILCQINFVLFAIDEYITPEVPTKLRFAYLMYYYLCDFIPQINEKHGLHLKIDTGLYSKDFRNAMAHYKVGVFLKQHEIIKDDPMFGMTQKAFGSDFYETKECIIDELRVLSKQLENYLKIYQEKHKM